MKEGGPVVKRLIRVLLVDDHPALRKGLKFILEDVGDMSVVGEMENGYNIVDAVRKGNADVVILDLSMPGRSGLEALHDLKTSNCAVHVLALTMHDEQPYVVRALQAGASGFITKDASPEDMVKAVRQVAAGDRYLSPQIRALLVHTVDSGSGSREQPSLSVRETEVLVLFGKGYSVTEIAEHLSLSVKTISTYRKRLLDKLCISTNIELRNYARNNTIR